MAHVTQLNITEKGSNNPSFPEQNKNQQKSNPASSFPLSYNQQSIWLRHILEPDSVANNISQAIHLENEIDPDIFRYALQKTVDRHPALRTTFTVSKEQPIQIVHEYQPVFFQQVDASKWDEDRLDTRLTEEVYHLFDLENGPLFRAFLFTRTANDHVFLLTMHHIITDMWSVAILLKDFFAIYQNETLNKARPLPRLRKDYFDFTKAQQELLAGPEGQRLQAFWQKQLAGDLPVLDLPSDRLGQTAVSYHGAAYPTPLGPALTDSLKQIAASHNTSLFSVLLAAYQLLLHRYSGQNDVLVGTPKANRTLKTARLIGYFINPIVLRSQLTEGITFSDFLQQTHQTVEDAFAHDAYPFQKLIEDFQATRDWKTTPFFRVAFAWQKSLKLGDKRVMASGAVGKAGTHTQVNGFVGEPMPTAERSSPLDITLQVGDMGDDLVVTFEYKRDLFSADTIARMAKHLQTLLAGIAANPNQPAADLPLLTAAEIAQLEAWNDTAVSYQRNSCIHHLFETEAEQTAGKTAVTFDNQSLTYQQLNQRANQLARHLQSLGVGRGDLVGINLERSLEMVIALFAILKTGAAYIPLDPAFPQDRLDYMLADSQARVLLTQTSLLASQPVASDHQTICVDRDAALFAAYDDSNLPHTAVATDLAYIIYTSGSTGKPKGVQIEHRSALNFLNAMRRQPGLNADDVLLAVTTLSFDIAVLEIFLPLLNGAQVALVSRDTAVNPAQLQTALQSSQATILQATPTTWRMLLEAGWPGDTNLKALCGGEAMPRDLADQLSHRCGELWNMYGPTETTVWSSVYRIQPDNNAILVGKPIDNTTFYILDKQQRPLPIGISGELYIGGDGLARGYLNRPELTAEKFIEIENSAISPQPSTPLYRTGDLARFLPDGNVELFCRIDNQVKVRGYRIELGEIETVLAQHPNLRDVVVTAHEVSAGDMRLVAYYIPKSSAPAIEELRSLARASLPDYMVPTAFVALDTFPLTPNKKVDRNAMPAPDWTAAASLTQFTAPQTPQQELTAVTWREVLGLEKIGIHDNFFELGGHSLLATQIISRLREKTQVDLPIRAIFEAPTIAELAGRITELQATGSALATLPLAPAERTAPLPLSFSQERMWFLHQLNPTGTAYNIPGAVRLHGPLDVAALEWSINQTIARHESLRTRFTAVDGHPTAIIEPTYTYALPIEDCRTIPPANRQDHVASLMEKAVRPPFHLDQIPLFQIKLYQLDEEEHILLVNVHHIIFDQWSSGVLSRDVAAFYRAYITKEPAVLAPMPIQSADHAIWQRQLTASSAFDAQMAYWKQQLSGLTTLDLPSDRPRPAMQTANGAIFDSPLPAWLNASLQKLSQQESASPYMILLAAFKLLLFRYTGAEDIAIGSPIANRHQTQSETLITTLVNTLVLRTNLSGNPTFRHLLQQVQKTALDAYAHQDVPFEKLVDELQPQRDTSRSPLFQVFFNVQNAPFALPDLPQIESDVLEIDRGAAQFDLSLSVNTTVTQRATLEYNTDLFDVDRMERMMEHYWQLLEVALADPDQPIADLPLLTTAEIAQLEAWNDTAVPYQHNSCIHHVFETQVEQSGGKTAVTFQDQALTYQQLNQRANRLARHLQSLGVGRGDLVGINLERSLKMVIALFAVHKAGAAYIPLDPGFPQDRLDFMLADSQARVLITQTSLLDSRGAEETWQYVCVDRDTAVIDQYDDHNLPHSAAATDLAYIIYTSGSTGKPKGVQIEHRSALNFLNAMRRQPGLAADDVLLAVTTLSFDIAVLEIFLPLLNGAQVALVSRDTAVNAVQLQTALQETQATILQATPTTWRMLLEAGWPGDANLKALCGGEAMPRDLADQLLPRCGQLWNMYGPTETTVWSSVYRVRPSSAAAISIGQPIDNTTFYILDKEQRPLPVGVPGELFIGGDGLARGYLNRPELTAEKFIQAKGFIKAEENNSAFHLPPSALIYRTGDLARFLPDGNVEFFGRIDHQVKIRGYRIELGEIEAVLVEHPALREVVVTPQEISAGDKRLVAYYIPETGNPAAEDLRTFARASLPDYMIPAAFVAMESFPLTPNKKINRRALPMPQTVEQKVATAVHEAPQDALEIQLTRIWEKVLGVTGVGRSDNFFELGGHSLLAVRVFAEIEAFTHVQLPLTALFRAPTIAQLADILRGEGYETRWTSLVPIQAQGARPIFFHVAPFLVSVLVFSELSRYLGNDQPIYGLQPQGLEGDDPYHDCVEDMAAHYIKEMRSLQPEGPYIIGGHCAGNWVAFEVAQQLQAQGEEVSLLVLVDSEPPNIAPPQVNRIKYYLSRIAYYWKDGRFWDAFKWKLGLAYQRFIILRTGDKTARRVAAVRKAHADAHQQYHSGTFNGDAILIRSHESVTTPDKDWHLRWSELITGQLHHEEVPGTHAGLIIDPGVSKMADIIRNAIDDVIEQK